MLQFQEFLQCYGIDHKTSSPMHPKSNSFVECLVGIAKKLTEKAGKREKLWNIGLFKYRMTINSAIPSPIKVMMQGKPRTKPPLQCWETAHNVQDALIRCQGNNTEVSCSKLETGTLE